MISLDAQLKTVMTNLRWYPRGRCRRCVAGVDRPQASIGRGLSDVHNLLAMSPHGVAVVPANSARANFQARLLLRGADLTHRRGASIMYIDVVSLASTQ